MSDADQNSNLEKHNCWKKHVWPYSNKIKIHVSFFLSRLSYIWKIILWNHRDQLT